MKKTSASALPVSDAAWIKLNGGFPMRANTAKVPVEIRLL